MRLITKYFSDIFSLKTCNKEVAELGVRLIAECALKPNNYGTLFFRIFLDLYKAFDTVDHRIILNKLEYYGIWGVVNDWFASYLSNRRQFVSLFGTNSDYQTVTCGVPQGSVLGPLLFLLYINDMPKCSNILEFHLFADDTNLFLNSPNILNLETNLNVELEKISQ